VSGQLHAPTALLPGKVLLLPIGWEAGWAPDPVWAQQRADKIPAPTGKRTPFVQPVSQATVRIDYD